MKRTPRTRVAILFFALLVGAYLHFYGMLFLTTSHCPHEVSDHAECIATMSGFTQPNTTATLPLLLPVFLIIAMRIVTPRILQSVVVLTEVRPLVGLFRRGILNPKAP